MARNLSPSVQISEIDKSTYIENIATLPTAMVLPFRWGPAEVPTLIANEKLLAQTFLPPNASNEVNWMVASDFLQYASGLYAARVVNHATARNAVGNGQTLLSLELMNVAGDFDSVTHVNIGSLFSDAPIVSWDSNSKVLVVDIDSGSLTFPIIGIVTDSATIPLASGTISNSIKSHILIENEKVSEVFLSGDVSLEGTSSGISPVFVARYPGQVGDGLAMAIVDANAANVTLVGPGITINNIENLVPVLGGYSGTSSYAMSRGFAGINDLMHVLVFDMRGDFTGSPGSILERYEFVSKLSDAINDSNETIYWKDVINAQSSYIYVVANPNTANGVPNTNIPNVVSVSTVDTVIIPADVDNFVGPWIAPIVVNGITVANGNYFILNNQGITNAPNGVYQWITVDTSNNLGYARSVSSNIGDVAFNTTNNRYFKKTTSSIFTDMGTGISVPKGAITNGNGENYGGWGLNLSQQVLSTSALTRMAVVSPSITDGVPTHNGFTCSFDGGADGSTLTLDADIEKLYTNKFDAADITIRQIIAGPASTVLTQFLVNFAQERQDCVAFVSPIRSTMLSSSGVYRDQNKVVQNVVEWAQSALNTPSSYGFLDGGWYLKYNKYTATNLWVPLNGQTAGLSAQVDANLDPWWSFSGYRRGIYRNVIKLAYNPNIVQRDLLYPANVNPVISEPGAGVVLLGDKTLLPNASVFSRINVRKLFIAVEQQIKSFSKLEMFEFNDPITRQEFTSAITPFLKNIQERRGIVEFKVVCDGSNNGPQIIANHEFVADIYIKPNETINWVKLNFVAVGQTLSIAAATI